MSDAASGSASAHTGRFAAYGLRVRSEVAVPFVADPAVADPDLTIRLGAVPRSLTEDADRPPIWEATPGAYLLNVEGIARYLVKDGREIVVEPAGDQPAAVTAFLLGPVMAACLQQRGILTLHASAIETESGAVLFTGSSAAGKSALAAALVERGHNLLADNIAAVVSGPDDRPLALSAFPAVSLWADAVDKLGWRSRTRAKVRNELEKYVFPVTRFRASPLPVRAIIELQAHNRETFEVASLSPRQAMESLIRFTYRSRCVHALGAQVEHFRAVGQLARRVRIGRVTRPSHPFRLDELANEILLYLAAD